MKKLASVGFFSEDDSLYCHANTCATRN